MRLKTQLVLAITVLVFLISGLLSLVYLGQLLHSAVRQSYDSNRMVANQLRFALQNALENGLAGVEIAPGDSVRLHTLTVEAIRRDATLAAMLESVSRYSLTVNDVAITGDDAVAILSTDPAGQDKPIPARPDYQTLLDAGSIRLMRIVFGPPAVYQITAPIERNGQPFVVVQVGVRTTLLRAVYAPWIAAAFTLMGFALLAALVAAFFLGNFALRPLEEISAQLDSVLPEQDESQDGLISLGLRLEREDLAARVTHKIERVGQRVRSVEQLYSTLQGNLDRILANLEDGLLLFSRDRRALLVSAAAQRFLGREGEPLVGLHFDRIFASESELGQTLAAAFARHESLSLKEVHTAAGRRLHLSLQFVDDARQSLGALITLHDPESVEQIGSDLELSRRMAAIGRLTSGVGHEVKNPINAIVVHLELLKNKLADSAAPAHRHLAIIDSEIHRLDRVVQLLVDFSRPVELHLADLDLRALVAAVLDLAGADLTAQAITLQTDLPAHPLWVHADADLLRQAMLNIVRNAAQAMTQGGQLTVALDQNQGSARLRIADNGPGIPPDIQEKIFNLYFTTKAEGSGIGLAMTYRILQLHHGSIDVQSEPGAGAEFVLRLPLTAPPEEGSHA